MLVTFLDIDGVLNTGNYMEYQWIQNGRTHKGITRPFDYNFDPKCMKNFKHFLKVTDSKIVVSSTWRMGYMPPVDEQWLVLMENLKTIGADERFIGITPIIKHKRGKEIQYWLEHTEHDVENFVIIDDDAFDIVEEFPDKIAKCKFKTGFTNSVKKKALKIIGF